MAVAPGEVTRSPSGFTLVEVLLALVLVTTTAAGSVAMFAVATNGTRRARGRTSATILAVQKIEQLRALSWGGPRIDGSPPVTDSTTDLSRDPPTASGTGLSASPPGSLSANLPAYVDYLDDAGRWVGTGTTPPPRTVWIRRWSIQPLVANPDALVLQVLVTPRAGRSGDVRLVSVKARKAE